MTKILLSLLFMVCSGAYLQAQNEVISLWEGQIPGGLSSSTYSENLDYEQGRISGARRVTEPTLSVFLPAEGTATGASVIICPGGGYGYLSMDKEGSNIGEWLSGLGITAFVLKYRLPSDEIMEDKAIGPLQDAQRAVRYVRKNAEKWNLATDKLGIMGFSAGGHLAATASTLYEDETYGGDTSNARPDYTVLIYPVISMAMEITHLGSRNNLLGENADPEMVKHFSNELQVTASTPKTFLVHSADDAAVPVENSLNYFAALKEHQVPAEMHIYEDGGHGYGMGRTLSSNAWPAALESWLEKHGLIER